MRGLVGTAAVLLGGACAAPTASAHGTASGLTAVEAEGPVCSHRVPERACVKHHPALAGRFQALGDWCAEHAVPESQCLVCHPDLTFAPLPALPAGADLQWLTRAGDDVGPLEAAVVPGKVTLFDYFADWCAPCRTVDAHVYRLLQARGDLAVRKLNVVTWETPLARGHLAGVEKLPYLVVFGRDGRRVRALAGLDLAALDAALAEAAR